MELIEFGRLENKDLYNKILDVKIKPVKYYSLEFENGIKFSNSNTGSIIKLPMIKKSIDKLSDFLECIKIPVVDSEDNIHYGKLSIEDSYIVISIDKKINLKKIYFPTQKQMVNQAVMESFDPEDWV